MFSHPVHTVSTPTSYFGNVYEKQHIFNVILTPRSAPYSSPRLIDSPSLQLPRKFTMVI